MSEPINRREFLKLTTVGAAVIAGVNSDNLKSHEYIFNSNILVLDFFNVPPSNNKDLLETVPQNDEQAKELVSNYFIQQFGDHGESVIVQMEKTAAELGVSFIKKDITVASVLPAVSFGTVQKDGQGNTTVDVNVSAEIVENLISQSNASVVNMSFEVGTIPIHIMVTTDRELKPTYLPDQLPTSGSVNGKEWYKLGNKEISKAEYEKIMTDAYITSNRISRVYYEDGYSGEETYNNLKLMANVARKFPDKIFLVAGGNPDSESGKRPDIRETRKRLEAEGVWTPNLIVCGYVAEHPLSKQIEPMQLGADYYLEGVHASSLATASVTQLVSKLIKRGNLKTSTIRQDLDGLSQAYTIDITDNKVDNLQFKILNARKE